jgi:hypothetical protein
MLPCLSAELSAVSARRTSRAIEPVLIPNRDSLSPRLADLSAGGGYVAQIFNLPYRRIVFGSALDRSHVSASSNAPQSATLRYSAALRATIEGAEQ